MEADWKLNVLLGGRVRLEISSWRWFRKDRISSFLDWGIEVQRGWVAERRSFHSARARDGEVGERRWLKSVFSAALEGEVGSSGMRRTRRPGCFSFDWFLWVGFAAREVVQVVIIESRSFMWESFNV